MTASATQRNQNTFYKRILPWLDALTLLAWGALLVKLWMTGRLRLLIHPNYTLLVLGAGIVFLAMGGMKGWELYARNLRSSRTEIPQTAQHITLFPLGWSTGLLLATAIAGLIVPPKILGSETALQRGVTASLPFTQTQTQTFRTTIKPEERTIIDWVRTFNAYPEPDAYNGQTASVIGFVVRSPDLPEGYIYICRFMITCCAVDAYPVGLIVKLPDSVEEYPPDRWLNVEGILITETVAGKRQAVIEVASSDDVTKVPTPRDPYEFNQ
ncbi:MAG: TIGR03943 family protein [Cyanobacteriota bacterium]|nr:TIGR03943 family protein [Cyanobacteriota bacterium]